MHCTAMLLWDLKKALISVLLLVQHLPVVRGKVNSYQLQPRKERGLRVVIGLKLRDGDNESLSRLTAFDGLIKNPAATTVVGCQLGRCVENSDLYLLDQSV